jgi:tetraacyldisaccharide 4'-kinase
MKEPWFWRDTGIAARAASAVLAPAAFVYDCGQRLRAATTNPESAGAPVVCIGNATLGGVGKTPFALMLQQLLKDRGVAAHFLSRGYGGSMKGSVLVNAQHRADEVGDEPLLLAAAAPTWVAKDRVAGARAAAGGADVIIMDDGFQNPTIRKDLSFLLMSSADKGDNSSIFPAGPLREPFERAVARAGAVVIVGAGAPAIDTGGRPLYRAATEIHPTIAPQKAIAFCGIARPERFFTSLEEKGFGLATRIAFPDHHAFTPAELAALRNKAKAAGAALITTQKDYVRLAPEEREDIAVAKLVMIVDDPAGLAGLVMTKIGRTQ